MSIEAFCLGVAQMTSTDDVSSNLRVVSELYAKAVAAGAELVVFPENSLFMRIRSGSSVQGLLLDGAECKWLCELVVKAGAPILLTTPVTSGGGKCVNSTLLFEPGRAARQVYSKIHLFDVDVAGAPAVRESDHFERGAHPAVVEIGGWKFGLSICYDLRFSELYARYAQAVDVILIPSAFLVPTGEAHWDVLVRARAIEAQCFVAAPAQAGEHLSPLGGSGRQTYGHSMVVDPWGRVLLDVKNSPEVHVVEMNRELIVKARTQIPMSEHRRLSHD